MDIYLVGLEDIGLIAEEDIEEVVEDIDLVVAEDMGSDFEVDIEEVVEDTDLAVEVDIDSDFEEDIDYFLVFEIEINFISKIIIIIVINIIIKHFIF